MSESPPTPPEDPAPEHRRRPRYRGKHPRQFAQKYKELDAANHPDLIAQVRARGATPAGQHIPILVDEILEVLHPTPGERGVDATLGFGGHAARILERLRPGGQLLALDADSIELAKTEARLREAGHDEAALSLRRTNFASLSGTLAEQGWSDGIDFLLADLGLSSMQIDDPARGFTFKHDGPLDMRMNRKRGLSAAQFLARVSTDELEAVLERNADEPRARLLAQAIVARRGSLASTLDLARAVRETLEVKFAAEVCEQSVRLVFQALRIEVNDEFGVLDRLLEQLPACLRPGGRVAMLSFHSGEDRRIKKAFEQGRESGVYRVLAETPMRACADERRANPRSASAKLRWAVRSGLL